MPALEHLIEAEETGRRHPLAPLPSLDRALRSSAGRWWRFGPKHRRYLKVDRLYHQSDSGLDCTDQGEGNIQCLLILQHGIPSRANTRPPYPEFYSVIWHADGRFTRLEGAPCARVSRGTGRELASAAGAE